MGTPAHFGWLGHTTMMLWYNSRWLLLLLL
jgi:hypothetical protein